MSRYLVIPRGADSPAVHVSGSTEETVCEIAKNLLYFPGPTEKLMAVPADSKIATFALVKDEALCSLEVTDTTLDAWRNDVTNIEDAINQFNSAKDQAASMLESALADLDEAYESSTGFNGCTPSHDISVYEALRELSENDLEYEFRESLAEMYQFQFIKRLPI